MRPIELPVADDRDPLQATLDAARHDLGAGARAVVLDISSKVGVPSLVNAVTF